MTWRCVLLRCDGPPVPDSTSRMEWMFHRIMTTPALEGVRSLSHGPPAG